MTITKSVLNMAAYAIVLVLILILGLALLKAKGTVKDNADAVASAGELSRQNKEAIDKIDEKIDTAVAARIAQVNKSFDEKLNLLRAQDIKYQQQLAELQRKVDTPAVSDDGLKWVIDPLTRHRYTAIPFALPWHAAKAYAEANGGHLVVINGKEENDWLVATFGGDTEYWTGLTDEAEEGKWKAVNGETTEYFNWAPPEPDNYRKHQHYVVINSKAPHLNQTDSGRWNDVPANEMHIGIIERPL
jgi:hypothetical protein